MRRFFAFVLGSALTFASTVGLSTLHAEAATTSFHTNSVYWTNSGILLPSESLKSGKLYLSAGTKVLDVTHISKSVNTNDPYQGSYVIKLLKMGKVVDQCLGDTYDFEVTGSCYFENLKSGGYEVTITNLSSPEFNVLNATLRDE